MEEIHDAKERSLFMGGEPLGCLLKQQNSNNFMTTSPCIHQMTGNQRVL